MRRKTKQVKIYYDDWRWLVKQDGTIAEVINALLTSKKRTIIKLVEEEVREEVRKFMETEVMPYVKNKLEEVKNE